MAYARENSRGKDGIAPQLEKVVIDSDRFRFEDLAPDVCDETFEWRRGQRARSSDRRRAVVRRKCLRENSAPRFAGGRSRNLRDDRHMARNLEVGKALCREGAKLPFARSAARMKHCRSRGLLAELVVRNRECGGVLDGRMPE